jgi:hypothetical protein
MNNYISKLLNKLSKKFLLKEIKSKQNELIFRRWGIQTKYIKFYIHKLYQSDKDLHPHSHPWNYITFILKGSYAEQYTTLKNNNLINKIKFLNRFNINYHKREDYHKITLLEKPTTTFLIAIGKNKDWGYLTPQGHVHSEEYRTKKNNGTLLSLSTAIPLIT